MPEKSIAIIGAGIAGLSAGCYAQMNGYRSEIFEMHTLPGGVCTSWRRGEYVFDGCIDWLVGIKPGSAMSRFWKELGALEDKRVVIHDEYGRVVAPDGKRLVVYSNLDRLEQEMKRISPGDAKLIEELVRGSRSLATGLSRCFDPGEAGLTGRLWSLVRLMPFLVKFRRYSRQSAQSFVGRFRSLFLREALRAMLKLPDFPVSGLMMMLGWHDAGDAGYPVGGSLQFARGIERRYRMLGGKVHYSQRVAKVLVENGAAVGVRTDDGVDHRADIVISAADGHATIFDMLEGKYTDKRIRSYYTDMPLFPGMLQISLGVARDFSAQPHRVIYLLETPLVIAGDTVPELAVKHYSYDPTLAPPNHSTLVIWILSQYEHWKRLMASPVEYEREKALAAQTVLAALGKFYPGIADDVREVDVATPLTWERYTGNWKGAFEGWLPTTRTMKMTMMGGMKKTLPGLRHFHMIGQWVSPGGGLPVAAMTARDAIQSLCKSDKRKFTVEPPESHAAAA